MYTDLKVAHEFMQRQHYRFSAITITTVAIVSPMFTSYMDYSLVGGKQAFTIYQLKARYDGYEKAKKASGGSGQDDDVKTRLRWLALANFTHTRMLYELYRGLKNWYSWSSGIRDGFKIAQDGMVEAIIQTFLQLYILFSSEAGLLVLCEQERALILESQALSFCVIATGIALMAKTLTSSPAHGVLLGLFVVLGTFYRILTCCQLMITIKTARTSSWVKVDASLCEGKCYKSTDTILLQGSHMIYTAPTPCTVNSTNGTTVFAESMYAPRENYMVRADALHFLLIPALVILSVVGYYRLDKIAKRWRKYFADMAFAETLRAHPYLAALVWVLPIKLRNAATISQSRPNFPSPLAFGVRTAENLLMTGVIYAYDSAALTPWVRKWLYVLPAATTLLFVLWRASKEHDLNPLVHDYTDLLNTSPLIYDTKGELLDPEIAVLTRKSRLLQERMQVDARKQSERVLLATKPPKSVETEICIGGHP
ncbi:hypothetical protein OAN61_00290 [bacterium]|nr:hypothetical protein [bacterium]